MGAAVGTGLFISSGEALANAGPLALLAGFVLVGTVLFNVMMALAELAVLYPVPGSFSVHASRFTDPAWGFAVGWNYALQWLIVLPLELTASAIMIRYWNDEVPIGIWISVFWLVVIVMNCLGVRGYGKATFIFFVVKFGTLIGFVVLGIVILVGGVPSRKLHGPIPWEDFGSIHNSFKGFCSVIVTASFAFSGMEMAGLAAAESKSPETTVPRAIRQTLWLTPLSYIITLLFIVLLVPQAHPMLLGNSLNLSCVDTLGSPFLLAIQDAQIKVLPSTFMALILVSVLSVGISAVYGSSRVLCAMARCGQAPAFFGIVDRHGRPLVSILVAVLFGGVAYIGQSGTTTTCEIFDWLFAVSGLSTVVTWTSICLSHIMFRKAWKAQGRTLEQLPFKATFGVVGSWYGLIMNVLILFAQLYISVSPIDTDSMDLQKRISKAMKSFLAVVIVTLFYFIWKVCKKTHFMVPGRTQHRQLELLDAETIDLDVDRNVRTR